MARHLRRSGEAKLSDPATDTDLKLTLRTEYVGGVLVGPVIA